MTREELYQIAEASHQDIETAELLYSMGFNDFSREVDSPHWNAHVDTARSQLEQHPNDAYWIGVLEVLTSKHDINDICDSCGNSGTCGEELCVNCK